MAAETADQLTVALFDVTDEDAKLAGAVQGTNVVNCAAAAAPVPEAQVAVSLQSYNEPEVNPVKAAVVAVCAADKFVHVPDEFNL